MISSEVTDLFLHQSVPLTTGVTAIDACVGDVGGSIEICEGEVDPAVAGEYEITYCVSDGSGNQASRTRLFRVNQYAIMDIDQNGAIDPKTDGKLILRYLFGLRGNALIDNALDTAKCRRCEADEIETILGEYWR